MKQKTFHDVLSTFSENVEAAKDALNDKRLTQFEKTIIEGYLNLRDNKNLEVIHTMESYQGECSNFVLAQKHLLLALAYNNLNQFTKAEELLLRVLPSFEMSFPYFEFMTRVNLFINYLNTQQISKMYDCLKQLEMIPNLTIRAQIRLCMCQFFYNSAVQEDLAAGESLQKINSFKDQMTESDWMAHLINVFSFAMKTEDMEKGEEVLNEIIKHRKYRTKENFKFMKTLFFHLTENKPIYITDDDFVATPFLYYQIKLIQKLEGMELGDAKFFWGKLQNMFPEQYLDHFQYRGPKCLFSLCLHKHQSKLLKPMKIEETGSHLEKLDVIFKSHPGPYSKDELFEALWGRKPVDKSDYVRLSNTLARFKAKSQITIKTRKGCYHVA